MFVNSWNSHIVWVWIEMEFKIDMESNVIKQYLAKWFSLISGVTVAQNTGMLHQRYYFGVSTMFEGF